MIDGSVLLNGVQAERQDIEPFTMPSCGTHSGEVFTQYQESLPRGATYRILDGGSSEMDNIEPYDVPADHYFVLGDHRDNSIDSRWSEQVGMVHKRYLISRVRPKLGLAQFGKVRLAAEF